MCDNYYFYEKQTHPLKKKRDFNTMTTDFGQNRKRNERFSKPKGHGPPVPPAASANRCTVCKRGRWEWGHVMACEDEIARWRNKNGVGWGMVRRLT